MNPLWAVATVLLCASAVRAGDAITVGPLRGYAQIGDLPEKTELNLNDTIASSHARKAAEYLRKFFKSGLGAIPPLDPYRNEAPAPIELDKPNIKGIMELSNLVLLGNKGFRVRELEVRLDSDRVDFAFYFPLLSSEVDVAAALQIDEAAFNLTLRAKLSLKDVIAKGATGARREKVWADCFVFTAIELALDADDVQYNVQNIPLVEPLQGSTGTKPGSAVTKAVAEAIKGEVTRSVAQTILNQLNDIFRNYTVKQVLKLLYPYE